MLLKPKKINKKDVAHVTESQYFVVLTKKYIMHNIKANFDIFMGICKKTLKKEVDRSGNLRFYPRSPKMNDLEIISLAITMETLSIDSENLFWKKLQNDFHKEFPNLNDRTRFNRRRKQLAEQINYCWAKLSNVMNEGQDTYVVDSMPIPVVKLVRETTRKSFSDDIENAPKKGYSATNKQYIIGYKIHLIVSKQGVPADLMITPANVHDINFLKERELELINCTLLGDKAYLSKTLQLDLFESNQIKLKTAYRSNQIGYKKLSKKMKGNRMIIETINAQLCDQFMIKRNYAKSFSGLYVRIISKVAALTFSQYVNFEKNRPIGKVKFALAS